MSMQQQGGDQPQHGQQPQQGQGDEDQQRWTFHDHPAGDLVQPLQPGD